MFTKAAIKHQSSIDIQCFMTADILTCFIKTLHLSEDRLEQTCCNLPLSLEMPSAGENLIAILCWQIQYQSGPESLPATHQLQHQDPIELTSGQPLLGLGVIPLLLALGMELHHTFE